MGESRHLCNKLIAEESPDQERVLRDFAQVGEHIGHPLLAQLPHQLLCSRRRLPLLTPRRLCACKQYKAVSRGRLESRNWMLC